MADLGGVSVLQGCLSQAFSGILQREFERVSQKGTKEDKLQKKKTKTDKKEEDKGSKEPEECQVFREGMNSLITYSNASCFSVFSHVRHFVLQQQLCDVYNLRTVGDGAGGDGESEEEEEKESEKESQVKLPEVVSLGIVGVFSILKNVWQTNADLCLQVLEQFLNILQGQNPAGLKNEPAEATACLFDLLLEMVSCPVTASSETVSQSLSSVAASCLLSLVISLGDTDKILSAITALLITAPEQIHIPVKVPSIMHSLQTSVQAVLLGGVYDVDWLLKGVPSKSLVDTWPPLTADKAGPAGSITSDGRFLYLHGPFGLQKVGSGFGNTIKGRVYDSVQDFHNGVKGYLGRAYTGGKVSLVFFNPDENAVTVLMSDDLSVLAKYQLDENTSGAQCFFADGKDMYQIKKKEDDPQEELLYGCSQVRFVLRQLTAMCNPMIAVDEREFLLSHKSVVSFGRAKYDSQSSLHYFYQSDSEEVVRVIAAKNFAAVQTASGKLFYTGSGVAFGITGKEVAKGEWKPVELPDPKAKVVYSASDFTGSYCHIVTDKGIVYFGGLNKKGESGESPPGGRQQPKPAKLKRVMKLKDHEVDYTACGPHCSAIITKNGKLYMFGSVEEDLVDKSSGVVTKLKDITAVRVSIGRMHTCVLTKSGAVYTFGGNQYGQCGRNYLPPSGGLEGQAEVDEEDGEESTDEEGDNMCPSGQHKWSDVRCMICRFCGFCTGYGPTCCNEGVAGREPGTECGCGVGDSGCSECGACKVCAGELNNWGGAIGFDELADVDADIYDQIRRIRAHHRKSKKDKEEKKKKKQKKRQEEDKGEMGLQLLFGGEPGSDKDVKEAGTPDKPPEPDLSTKFPGLVPLPGDQTAIQISCGAHHTAILLHSGEVYMFGNGNHGQLGQGNNKPCGVLVKVELPGKAKQVVCGDNHTVVLLERGDVFTFGKHQEGQLGRCSKNPEDNGWNMVPGQVKLPRDTCQARLVGAFGNQTFIGVDELLVSQHTLPDCQVFASTDFFGLVPPPLPAQSEQKLIMIDPATSTSRRLDGEDQHDLTGCSLCIDPEYGVLWSYSPSSKTVSCFNPVTSDVKDYEGTILSPALCLPHSKDAVIPRSQAGLNLLSCLHTLATKPPITLDNLTGKRMKSFSADEYQVLPRFNSQGGGWGYSQGSVEAIRFSPDQDILLGGYGLFGGRGSYNAEIRIYEIGDSPDPEGEGALLGNAEERSYTSERTKTCRLLFDRPVLLTGGRWYVAYAAITSPTGASSDAGSSGQQSVTGPDNVSFKIKNSRRSNNGTDVGSGQIPELLYRIPEFEQEERPSIQLLNKKFSTTVTPGGLQAVLKLLEWGWAEISYLSPSDSTNYQQLLVVVKATLGIISAHICELYPEKGINRDAPFDSPEVAECVHKTLALIRHVLSSRLPPDFSHIMDACRETFICCFHAFFPSVPLKWFALCNLLQQTDPSDIIGGFQHDNLLSAVLEALSSPSLSYIGLGYDTTLNLQISLYNSSGEGRFPVLTQLMHAKTMEEFDSGKLLSFSTVAAKLLSLVSAPLLEALSGQPMPSTAVIDKAGLFLVSRVNELALCSNYPNITARSGLVTSRPEKKEKLVESAVRFKSMEVGYPSLDVTDAVFSVNKPVQLNGFYVYCGSSGEGYQYKIAVLKKEEVIVEGTGYYNQSDSQGDPGMVKLFFKNPCNLEPEVIYTARVNLTGEGHTVGVEGALSLSGPGGVIFTIHSTDLSASSAESGPLARFIYTTSPSSTPHNVMQMSVHLGSMYFDLMNQLLRRLLSGEVSGDMLETLSSSFFVSSLLPCTIAQLGPIASRQPSLAVQVLEIVQESLPIISALARQFHEPGNGDKEIYSDTKLMHYANIETDHPYKPSTVSLYQVRFPDSVRWMSLEFDPRSGFAQPEDKIADLMIPRRNGLTAAAPSTDTTVSKMVGVSFEDLHSDWQQYGLDTPAGLVLLPGNEVHIVINTDTEYEKKEKKNHFGVKCKLIGYEWPNVGKERLLLLEKEIVTLGAMCAGALLKEDLGLPFPEELPVSLDPSDTEKADMRIVQAAAQEVLAKHPHLLSRGLMADPPSISSVLKGEVPVITDNPEQQFLLDFIKSKQDTSGGRLARWLQPDRSVDPSASELSLTSTDSPQVGKQCEFHISTKDQDGKVAFVEGMNVDVKAMWKGSSSSEGAEVKEKVDEVTGVRRPNFKRSYVTTMLGTNHVYQSMPMMMPYSDYSFEELRFYAPKVPGSMESLMIHSNKDGTYSATWTPSTPGSYSVQVYIEGSPAGEEQKLQVLSSKPSPEPEEVQDQVMEEEEGAKKEGGQKEVVIVETVKRKKFTGLTAQGLRVREKPNYAASLLGVIKPGDIVHYSEEIENETGRWVKLTADCLRTIRPTATSGYALSYSRMKEEDLLEEMEPEEIKHVMKKSTGDERRKGGPGKYTIVHCGKAGHNIRSKPSMKGIPTGRLAKGDAIEAVEEVENNDGIWLKLSPASLKKYCDGSGVDSAWTLVVHPSGRIFLTQDGDTSYQKFEPSSEPKVTFPTAASVFGTAPQSVFGLAITPSAMPVFAFGKQSSQTMKLSFGSNGGKMVELGEAGTFEPGEVFKFSSGASAEDKSEETKETPAPKEAKQVEPKSKEPAAKADGTAKKDDPQRKLSGAEKPVFSLGVTDGSGPRSRSPRRRRLPVKKAAAAPASSPVPSPSPSPSPTPSAGEEKEESLPPTSQEEAPSTHPGEITSPPKVALSPAMAECQRAIFAAFLWQEGLVHDAMASATYLKFHSNLTKEMRLDPLSRKKDKEGTKSGNEVGKEAILDDGTLSLPPTLNHLVTFWEEISIKVIEKSSVPFPPPKIPALAHELAKSYEEEKKELEKLKKQRKGAAGLPGAGGGGGGGGSTVCELCDVIYPDPVTYHMKDIHPGCGQHASGWGYNSRGSYCSGWAGNCGDGGRGGSTWYLMCKACHSKYISVKEDNKRKAVKPVFLPKMKTRKPGKPRSLPVVSAVQGMIQNAKFLLDISCSSDSKSKPQPEFAQQLSLPEDVSSEKSSSLRRMSKEAQFPLTGLHPRPPLFHRSVSVAVRPSGPQKRTQSDSGEESGEPALTRQSTLPSDVMESDTLMTKPSMALAKLVYQRSCQGPEERESGYTRVLSFILRYHDLAGLKTTMKQAMRIASLRAFATNFLRWLLGQVTEPSVIHDILWQFMVSVSEHPVVEAAARAKAEQEEDKSKDLLKESGLGKHPLTGLDGAGSALLVLRKEFHSFLQTIADIMGKLPVGSAAQQMALKCWCLEFQPADHSFLLQSRVFVNISDVLSQMDERVESAPGHKTELTVELMDNILSQGQLKVSSNDAMSNSLTDGSTETFWESRDEPRGKARSLTITFNKHVRPFAVCIHIDNQKDPGQRVEYLSLLTGVEEDSLTEVVKEKISAQHAGWKVLVAPREEPCSILRVEIKGLQNNVRVRQLLVLGRPSKCIPTTPTSHAQQKDCEEEALKLFRLLTAEVFGGLLEREGEEEEDEEATDQGTEEKEDEPTSMVNILFNKSSLSGLQKQVCQHIMDSVHTEAQRMKDEWKASTGPSAPPKLPPRQVSHDPSSESSSVHAKGKGPDTYCYELLSMLAGLSQTELGCTFLAEQQELVKDLVSLLHTAPIRIQLQVYQLLRRILPYIKPRDFATMMGVTVLPPLGYSAIAEAVNSAGTVNQLGLLDCLLAVIAKALSVQVKAKGRGSNIMQALTGDSSITAVTLANLTHLKPVPGESHVRNQRWYMHGSLTQEVAAAVINLLKDMTMGSLKGQWKDYAKSAIGQAVLHLTKIHEEGRNVDVGMYSQTLWLSLAALCVINEEHADALSSGQWLGQDGQPQSKPLCDNHDDGETKALILCEKCGNLCGECDRVLHYHRRTGSHQRQVFKEEEEAVKVDLHEGCGRIKLYWTMALADSRTLKGMVEFRDTFGGGGKGACRFCGTTSNTGLLGIGNVCSDQECQERVRKVCDKTLSCGHFCCGVKGEETCLPCLHGCGSGGDKAESDGKPRLKQDADDMCMICYTEGLSCAPCVQLECGHVFHFHCCHNALTTKWSGPRITFRFLFCSICEKTPINHPQLAEIATPLLGLYDDVKNKCMLRLEYENQSKCEAITSPTSKFFNKPMEYAMWKYAYYVCFKCKKAYYGGEAHCAEQAASSDDYDPSELVCPSCANVGGQMQVCPKHGTDFLEYKCRYCCTVAVYYCFGTTHFCSPCHDDFQRLTSMSKSEMPQCPVGPRAKPLAGKDCPLHIKHPPTGEEFALGCGVCRNAQTF